MGAEPHHPPHPWRAVPSRKHRLRTWPRAAAQFPRSGAKAGTPPNAADSDMDAFKPFLAKIASGAPLTRTEAEAAFDLLLSGAVDPGADGRLSDGSTHARRDARRNHRRGFGHARQNADGPRRPRAPSTLSAPAATAPQTYNISTLAAIIVAACGVPVAKHGNRAASSLSGATDVLSELGVRIGIAPDLIERSLREANIGFMTAQAHHPAMAPCRRRCAASWARALCSTCSGRFPIPPASSRALIGVFAEKWMEPIARSPKNPRRGKGLGRPRIATGWTKSPPPARPRFWRWNTAPSAASRSRLRKSA